MFSSPIVECREEDIQVNALSKTLLGLLLLSWLASLRPQRSTPAHLVFVTSGAHLAPDIALWSDYHNDGGILEHYSKQENWQGAMSQYAVSKLIAQYAVEEIAKMALSQTGESVQSPPSRSQFAFKLTKCTPQTSSHCQQPLSRAHSYRVEPVNGRGLGAPPIHRTTRRHDPRPSCPRWRQDLH